MLSHAVRQRISRGKGPGELFATSAAKALVRLHRCAASITEHRPSSALHPDINYSEIRTLAIACFKLDASSLCRASRNIRPGFNIEIYEVKSLSADAPSRGGFAWIASTYSFGRPKGGTIVAQDLRVCVSTQFCSRQWNEVARVERRRRGSV